jgi:threonine dehydratase
MTPSVHDIYVAQARLRERIRRTPLIRSAWLSESTGADVWLKLESLQIGHSFKARGALNAVIRLVEDGRGQPSSPVHTVVTASAGNHGQALAWAAREAGLTAVVFTPRDAARTKLDAIARFGADLRPVAENYDEAERQAIDFAAQHGAVFVSPYADPDVIAGGGTVALEIVDDLPQLDLVVVPVGGGGLISGIATALDVIVPRARIVGVEAAVNPALRTALDHGRITPIPVSPTIADGLGGNIAPEAITFDIVRRLVDQMTVASEGDLRAGIRELLAHEHLVAEGAGVAAVAAAGAGGLVRRGDRAVLVVSGANIDVSVLADVLRAPTNTSRSP